MTESTFKKIKRVDATFSYPSRISDPSAYRPLGRALEEDLGMRLDKYLGSRYLFKSRTQWQDLISTGAVLVNGQAMKKITYQPKLADTLSYYCPQDFEPVIDDGISVIWEKSGVIAVYKPPNLPMHEGGAYRLNTFEQVLHKKIGKEWAAVHRLDRETSGIVLCADSQAVRGKLCASLRERSLQKVYLAIVFGRAEKDEWWVDKPIGRLDRDQTKLRFKQGVTRDGFPSQTFFKVKERSVETDQTASQDIFTFLEVQPKTGRTHQIRVHSAWSGLPLIGEKKYNPDEDTYLEYVQNGFTEKVQKACLYERLCLHATAVRFQHPIDKSVCEVVSECPKDMETIWTHLKNKGENS
ncbi:MAG: RluA family pseudouridine synthase [Oligoflexales bacterium]|nr:RluA family pseudouridine synthase [Oligoflexales bacterium]